MSGHGFVSPTIILKEMTNDDASTKKQEEQCESYNGVGAEKCW